MSQEIKLVFENCEVINIPMENVTYLSIGDIKQSISYSNKSGAINTTLSIKDFYLSANNLPKEDVARIKKYRDITWVEFQGVDYRVEWTDSDMQFDENSRQKTIVSKDGTCVLIEISDD